MNIELLIDVLVQFKIKLSCRKIILKDYCQINKLSYTSTSRILSRDFMLMTLRTAYKILGLTPDRNLSQFALNCKLKDLLSIKESFGNKLI
jgi:hypothetical protein